MSQVNTIRGPIDSAALGRTLSHEHLTNGSGGMERIPGLMDTPERRREMVDRSVNALARVHQSGIESVIDLTPFDLGRQMWLFEEVAKRHAEHGVNVVCATGVYRWVPSVYFGWTEDEVAAHFTRDITEGIDGTGIKAGIIKLAWDLEARLSEGRFAPRVHLEKMARGAARAAKATGVPISCHTLATDALGTPLLDLFESEGLDLRASHGRSRSCAHSLSTWCRGRRVGDSRRCTRSSTSAPWFARLEIPTAGSARSLRCARPRESEPSSYTPACELCGR